MTRTRLSGNLKTLAICSCSGDGVWLGVWTTSLPLGSHKRRDHMGLDMAMLDRRDFINVFNDLVRFFKALLDITAGGAVDAVNVAAGAFVDMLLVNDRRARAWPLRECRSTAGNSSYSASISVTASSAISRLSAATAATMSPTQRTLSMTTTGWSSTPVPK